jgi:1-acyl-sn-glycerol-3-phosphate acyltransferase
MMRLRAATVLATLTVVTLPLIPVQWLALRLKGGLKRSLPVVWHRIACRTVGIRVREIGKPARRMPLSFVAKTEVASWPVFGLFAKLQRSVFVDRQRRSATGRTAEELGTRLASGDAMVLFAEGTSNSGNEVLPFRSALIGAARHALAGDDGEMWIQPLALAYTHLHGLPMGRQFRPHVAWYGDMEMVPHFMNVVRQGAVDVAVVWGEPIRVRPDMDRKTLTRLLEDEVRRLAGNVRAGHPPAGPELPPAAPAADEPAKADEPAILKAAENG